jgi:hypothetical protein
MTSLLTALSTVLVPLVDSAPAPEDVRPGWIAFGVFVAMAVATILLWMNMRKQLKRIDFDDGSTPAEPLIPTPGAPDGNADNSSGTKPGTSSPESGTV